MSDLDANQVEMMAEEQKQYDRKMLAWSVDRATEVLKIGRMKDGAETVTAEQMITEAKKIVAYVYSTPDEPIVPTKDEAASWKEQKNLGTIQ